MFHGGLTPPVLNRRRAGARFHRVERDRISAESAMRDDVEREPAVGGDALAFSAQRSRDARFDVDVLARRKAVAYGDEAAAMQRDQLKRERTRAIARSDRIRNHARERGHLVIFGRDGDPPSSTP